MADSARTIGIAGGGAMGTGIAQIALQLGMPVLLHAANGDTLARGEQRLERAFETAVARGRMTDEQRQTALSRLTVIGELERITAADVVIEAIAESLKAKRALFTRLDTLCSEETILATTTSSLSVTAIAAATVQPQRVIGMHFFNPVPAIRLVEVVPGARTSPEVIQRTLELVQALDKEAIQVQNRPGFVVNRIARPFYGEALRILGEGVADVATVDELVKGMGFRIGPFALMDLIGIDVNLAVTTSIFEATFQDPRYRPHSLQVEMVEAGLLGRKSDKGFYEYPPR